MATAAALIVTLKEYVDESTTGSYPSNDECLQWLSEAEEIVVEETGCLTEYTASSVDVDVATVIDLPSDWIRGKQLMWGRTRHLDYVEIDDLLEASYNLTTTGVPSYWYIWDDDIQFYPVPSADETCYIYYVKAPAAMTTTSSSPSIPAHYQKLLPIYGAYKFWMKEEEPQMAAMFKSDFWEGLGKMKSTYNKKHARKQYKVHDTAGYL